MVWRLVPLACSPLLKCPPHVPFPNPQTLAISTLLQQPPANYFLASHTGSGKTLAYLLPLVSGCCNSALYGVRCTLRARTAPLARLDAGTGAWRRCSARDTVWSA